MTDPSDPNDDAPNSTNNRKHRRLQGAPFTCQKFRGWSVVVYRFFEAPVPWHGEKVLTCLYGQRIRSNRAHMEGTEQKSMVAFHFVHLHALRTDGMWEMFQMLRVGTKTQFHNCEVFMSKDGQLWDEQHVHVLAWRWKSHPSEGSTRLTWAATSCQVLLREGIWELQMHACRLPAES